MVKCTRCGKDFINEKQFEFIKKKLGNESHEKMCGKCRKFVTAERFKDIYKNAPVKK
jgi:hypothetical protein